MDLESFWIVFQKELSIFDDHLPSEDFQNFLENKVEINSNENAHPENE